MTPALDSDGPHQLAVFPSSLGCIELYHVFKQGDILYVVLYGEPVYQSANVSSKLAGCLLTAHGVLGATSNQLRQSGGRQTDWLAGQKQLNDSFKVYVEDKLKELSEEGWLEAKFRNSSFNFFPSQLISFPQTVQEAFLVIVHTVFLGESGSQIALFVFMSLVYHSQAILHFYSSQDGQVLLKTLTKLVQIVNYHLILLSFLQLRQDFDEGVEDGLRTQRGTFGIAIPAECLFYDHPQNPVIIVGILYLNRDGLLGLFLFFLFLLLIGDLLRKDELHLWLSLPCKNGVAINYLPQELNFELEHFDSKFDVFMPCWDHLKPLQENFSRLPEIATDFYFIGHPNPPQTYFERHESECPCQSLIEVFFASNGDAELHVLLPEVHSISVLEGGAVPESQDAFQNQIVENVQTKSVLDCFRNRGFDPTPSF